MAPAALLPQERRPAHQQTEICSMLDLQKIVVISVCRKPPRNRLQVMQGLFHPLPVSDDAQLGGHHRGHFVFHFQEGLLMVRGEGKGGQWHALALHRLQQGRFFAGPFPEDQAFQQRIAGQPVGTHYPCGGRFPADKEPSHVGFSVEIAPDAPHHVMGRRRHGYQLPRHVNSVVGQGLADGGKAVVNLRGIEVAQGEIHVVVAIPEHPVENGVRHHITGSQFGQRMDTHHKAFSPGIEEPGPFSPDRLTHQKGLLTREEEGRRMKLDEFQISNGGPGIPGQGNAVARSRMGIGRPAVDPRQPPRGQDDRPGFEYEVLSCIEIQGLHPVHAPFVAQKPDRRREFKRKDVLLFHHLAQQKPGKFPAGGISPGMQNPPPAVAPLKSEKNLALVIPVKGHAHPDQFPDPVTPLGDQHLHGVIITEAPAGHQGIGKVQRRRIPGIGHRGNTPLGKPGIAGIQFRLGHYGHPPEPGSVPCRCQPRQTAADHYGIEF